MQTFDWVEEYAFYRWRTCSVRDLIAHSPGCFALFKGICLRILLQQSILKLIYRLLIHLSWILATTVLRWKDYYFFLLKCLWFRQLLLHIYAHIGRHLQISYNILRRIIVIIRWKFNADVFRSTEYNFLSMLNMQSFYWWSAAMEFFYLIFSPFGKREKL